MVFIKAIRTVGLFFKLCFGYLFGNIISHLPCFKQIIVKQMNRKASIVMPLDNYWHTVFTWPMMKTLWKYEVYEIHKTATVNQTAPNPKIVRADCGEELALHEVKLHSLARTNRPLVVIFGSWTCPVFIERMNQLNEAHKEFSAIADFIVVYVQEAHPEDGWHFKNNYEIFQHKSIQDRLKAAQKYRSLLNEDIPLYADTIENEASKAYSGCPNRIIALKGTTLIYQNGPGPTNYFFEGIKKKLKEIYM